MLQQNSQAKLLIRHEKADRKGYHHCGNLSDFMPSTCWIIMPGSFDIIPLLLIIAAAVAS
jgi:hypothetical protein